MPRHLPIGAEVMGGGVHFRVWAPHSRRVELVLGSLQAGSHRDLSPEAGGYFSGFVPGASTGTLYRFRLDGDPRLLPDPASRYQPEGPHGPSEVIDPGTYLWRDGEWRGIRLRGQVLYELHVGTFTREGGFAAAARELERLAELGITAIELMPVSGFAGPFNWGYDGVNLFAPSHQYGTPDELRAFIDRAHGLGLAVLLDLVCNHLGPEGNWLPAYSAHYLSAEHTTEWGDAINFDGPDSAAVREFFIANAVHWIREYHFDGFRLDATQDVHDGSSEHILAALARHAREAAGERGILMIGENEPQDARLLRTPEEGGYGLDALWNDDFHHSAAVALTGRREAYYEDHLGVPQEFISAAKRGYLFQGQWYAHQGKRRGTPTRGLAPAAFVNYLQNHDQVANSARGERLNQLTSPGRWRAMTALLLLLPGTPLLFQGQEYGASTPFLYFADPKEELREAVRRGRAGFLAQFPSIASARSQAQLSEPHDRATFERCKPDPAERARNAAHLALHRDLLRLRRENPCFAAQAPNALDGAVLGAEAFALRFFGADGEDDRLLLVNLGRDLRLEAVPEPLLAPPPQARWQVLWSSEDPAYGGGGTPPLNEESWTLPGHCALVLAPGCE